MTPTQDRLKELFYYKDGFLHYMANGGPTARKDAKAGCARGQRGYHRMYVDGKPYYLHRLIWILFYGELPEQIDHIDGDRANSHVANLRAATKSQNHYNKGPAARNKSGFKGVCWHKVTKKWVVQIREGGRVKHLGYFEDPILAAECYDREAVRIQGEFARLNFPEKLTKAEVIG